MLIYAKNRFNNKYIAAYELPRQAGEKIFLQSVARGMSPTGRAAFNNTSPKVYCVASDEGRLYPRNERTDPYLPALTAQDYNFAGPWYSAAGFADVYDIVEVEEVLNNKEFFNKLLFLAVLFLLAFTYGAFNCV